MINDKPIYYHYCSLDTFKKIIENSKIRLSNPYKMNDSKELLWYMELLPSIINEIISNTDDMELKKNLDYFYNEAVKMIYEEDYLGKRAPYFACFSEEGDILSQWRSYANDGKGIAIGFDLSLLYNNSKNLELKKVSYDILEHNNSMKELLIQSGMTEQNNLKWQRMKDIYFDAVTIIEEIVYESVSAKNPAFREEKESRLVLYDIEDIRDKRVSGPFFRSTEDDMISYYEVDFSSEKSQIISSIFIGPKSKVTLYDLTCFLKQNQFMNVEIRKSAATYR